MTRRIALIGSRGQLGSDIVHAWPQSALAREGAELIPLTHSDIEVCEMASVTETLSRVLPDLIIDTAAFHRVDDIESRPDGAVKVNVTGARNVASAAVGLGAVMVYISTDHVFDGRATTPYDEDTTPSPVNMYGFTKLAGERAVSSLLPNRHVIVRTSGLFGVSGASGKGGNFVETMRRLASEGRQIRVVNDQVLSPSHTASVAEALLDVLYLGGRGTFHISNAGQCSWFQFAAEIFQQLGLEADLVPVSSEEYGAPAPRPAFSVLANRRLPHLGVRQPGPWQVALQRYLTLKEEAGALAQPRERTEPTTSRGSSIRSRR